MGIYPDHGIEYHVVLKNNKRFIIASTKATDDRLVKSKFFKDRESEWFAINHSMCVKMEDKDVDELDVELTEKEKEKLQSCLEKAGEDLDRHGWYDVCSIYDTYGPNCYGNTCEKIGYFVILKNGKRVNVTTDVKSRELLNEHDNNILKGILNVYDDQVESHGWYDD
jgi:hypothetical protein